MGWVLSVTRILIMRLLFNEIDGLDDSGLSTEDAYAAMDITVDLYGFGNEAQNVVALGLFVFCDEMEVGVAAKGSDFNVRSFLA